MCGPRVVFDLRVLIVDDNDEINEVIETYCTANNIDCEIINDGKQGLEVIRSGQFDLVLLDLAMPNFSIDVVNSLKQGGSLESKNIVIFTASSNPKVLEEMKNNGVKEISKNHVRWRI